ncbi:hypothetical protein, partial [Paramuribaculum intestinale]
QASDKINDLKEQAGEFASQASDKIGDLKDQAADKISGFTDKLKDMAADALESGANAVHNLASKLKD